MHRSEAFIAIAALLGSLVVVQVRFRKPALAGWLCGEALRPPQRCNATHDRLMLT
jgi:hypothetical protein